MFTNLNGDALALLERLPEGNIPGVRYNAKAGSVQIELQEKSDVDDAISKFQDAYKKIALSRDRRLRAEFVDVPVTRTKKEVQSQIAEFEQQYKLCAFVFEEEKQQVKVILQSRQFEQAKQFFRNALQEPQAAGSSGSPATEMVITLPRNRKLTLKKANIVEEEVNIIVNAANESLLHGGGVAGALDAASHGQLQKYSSQFMQQRRQGEKLPVGEVAVTLGGGDLRCKYVLHAVGPDNVTHSPSESERLIQLAILNTLKVAEKHNAISIAIPALSCGIYGVSKDLVTRSITDTILGFHFTKPPPTLSDIRIVIIDEPTHSCFARYFAKLPQRAVKGKAVASGHNSSTKASSTSGFSDVKYPVLPTDESMSGASGVEHHKNDHGTGAGHVGGTESSSAHAKEECPICLEVFTNRTKTKCGHKFCASCIQKALQYDPYCPSCKKPLRPITGKQPRGGTMNHKILTYPVPGYEGYNTIQISYTIPSGTQGPEHPNPGQPYKGASRVAYLPDNPEGREVLQLLQKAFQARLIFTVGTSVTTGAQNVVVWNDIHHKTNISGGQQSYGYPDPTYLQRVKEDLAAKGIVPDSSKV